MNLNLDIIKECYETLKRNRHIVGSIDPDYYLESTKYLLDLIEGKDLSENKEC